MEKSFTKKFWKLMKICALQLSLTLTLFGVAVAHSNFAQVLDKPVTVNLVDASFTEALEQIERAANVKFAYSITQLRDQRNVSLQAQGRSLGYILEELLSPRNIGYKVHENQKTITLKKTFSQARKKQSLNEPNTDMLLPVTGTVSDALSGQPMAGVNILVKGTTEGTTTDARGEFTIQANRGDILLFSFIGYAATEYRLNDETSIQILLSEDITSLQAVEINAGYYSTTKETQTGNITRVEAKEIARQPVSNALATLHGRVPGLEINQQTGVPGGNFRVRIRGINSLANGNDPLYIIDGVPFISNTMSLTEASGEMFGSAGTSPLNGINPADIESIEVLKDADATAIYGSRGSNGVILITTKAGKAGSTKVDVNFYSGFAQVATRMDLLTSPEYLMMRREAFRKDNLVPNAGNAPDLLLQDTTRYTDWQRELIGGNAAVSDAQVSISGGDRNTQYSFGGGFHKETTVFPGKNSDKRISTHLRISNTSVNQKFKSNISISYSFLDTDLFKTDLTGMALLLAPTAPALYNQDGKLNWGPDAYTSTFLNPHAYLKRSFDSQTKNLFSNAVVSYSLLPGLEVKANLGYTTTDMSAITLTPVSSYNPADAPLLQNTSVFANSTFQNWIVEPQLNYRKKAGANGFDILLGSTFLEQKNSATAVFASGFSNEALMKNLGAATMQTVSSNIFSQYRYHAVFLRANYSLKERYIINLTGRRDGSSRFGPGRQFANFGAVGAAWLFTKERFFENAASIFSFGKLRASYGITGNDQLGDYRYLDTYSPSMLYHDRIGLSPARLNNPDFAWESNRKLELGLALSFFNSKLSIDASYYRNRSSNQLIGSPLPPTTGFPTIQSNFPATVQNSGIEILLNSTLVETPKFRWSTSVNFTAPRNELISFPDISKFPSAISNRYVEGEPITILRQYHYLGVNPVNGLHEVEDVNGDGSLTVADRTSLKFVGQNFYGGLQNSFEFYNFQVDFLLQYSRQTALNYFSGIWNITPGFPYNYPREILQHRWQQEGDQAQVQRFSTQFSTHTSFERFAASDQAVSDASFIRLKNVSVSYSIAKSVLDKIRMEQARIFIQGQNLMTFTRYKGLDPETQNGNLPPLRTLTAGVQLTF